MNINEILSNIGMTKYRLAKLSGIPHATLSELCSGKTNIEKCSGETLYKIAKVLNVSMESLLDDRMITLARERSYEYGLPSYLQHDLDAYKDAVAKNSTLIDCYWGELYGSINMAEISDGLITAEHADYLRRKYLWR
ncbi:MAG: helix-turn-helix transcriptional regulator [Clostridia bacterium]|nr:helix-turn-helix transcriptional regulator [Clostridia bacterium]